MGPEVQLLTLMRPALRGGAPPPECAEPPMAADGWDRAVAVFRKPSGRGGAAGPAAPGAKEQFNIEPGGA